MAIRSFDDIGPKKNIVPDEELNRVNYIRRFRNLASRNFTELGFSSATAFQTAERSFEQVEAITDNTVRTNWFRRVASFYPEFMLADMPEVTIENNERMTEAVADFMRDFVQELQYANVDLLRYGEAVRTTQTHPTLSLIHI